MRKGEARQPNKQKLLQSDKQIYRQFDKYTKKTKNINYFGKITYSTN